MKRRDWVCLAVILVPVLYYLQTVDWNARDILNVGIYLATSIAALATWKFYSVLATNDTLRTEKEMDRRLFFYLRNRMRPLSASAGSLQAFGNHLARKYQGKKRLVVEAYEELYDEMGGSLGGRSMIDPDQFRTSLSQGAPDLWKDVDLHSPW